MNNNIISNYLKNNFSQIPNNLILDENLSPTSLKIMLYLFTRIDGWVVRNKDICNVCKISERTLTTKWKELQNSGWIERKEIRDDNGRFQGYNYKIGYSMLNNIKTTEYKKAVISKSKKIEKIDFSIISKYNNKCQELIKEFWNMKKELKKKNKKYTITQNSFKKMINFIDNNNVENDLDIIRIAIDKQWASLFPCNDSLRISEGYERKSKILNNNLKNSTMI